LALPNYTYAPAEFFKFFRNSHVARDVHFEFFAPKTGTWCRCLRAAGMAVPIASVNEQYEFALRKDDIRFAGKILGMKPKSESESVRRLANSQLRRRVLAPHPRH
jgi:hypothetical protein